jgi:hypothetical protein
MRIAIIGGGLFGATAAIYAARAGHDVHLFEIKHDLMAGATACSFNRLHRGAHYPRDAETGRESRRAEKSFRAEYGAAVIDGGQQLYQVPGESLVHIDAFREFLDNEGLSFSEDYGTFEVSEPRICFSRLHQLVYQKLADAGVCVHLRQGASLSMRSRFDKIIVAAYASLNEVLTELHCERQEYKYQLVERPLAELPGEFAGKSIVVIDGPFGCIDPLDNTGMHIIGHVVEANHVSNIGYRPLVPDYLAPLVNKGLIINPEYTKFSGIIEDLSQYIPGVRRAKHIGSSYTVRAVLAHQEQTDRRPTLVIQHDEQVISIFSGKMGTACKAAEEVVEMISAKEMVAA